MRRAILLAGAVLAVGIVLPGSAAAMPEVGIVLPGSVAASHGPPGTKLWAYEAATSGARILEYDIGADTFTSSCIPDATPNTNGRGIALDPVDGNLWYTRLTSFTGDGLIHKVTPPPACTPMGSIPFGDGLGGSVQDDVGALDIDPDDSNIWAAGYKNKGGLGSNTNNKLFKVDRVTGAILADCEIPPAANGGNDTLAIIKLAGLPGSGKYILTDDGEFSTTTLFVYDTADCAGSAFITPVGTYTLPFGVTGIDIEFGALIASKVTTLESLGGPPFGASVATMPAAPSSTVEDVTLETTPPNRPPDCSTAFADPDALWPPNHKFRTVTVMGVTDADGNPVTIAITNVTQDEPVMGRGSGHTAPDARNVNGASVDIRAERSGRGDGRVYHIIFTATDDQGDTCTGDVTVSVPHDRRGAPAVDSAPPSYPSL